MADRPRVTLPHVLMAALAIGTLALMANRDVLHPPPRPALPPTPAALAFQAAEAEAAARAEAIRRQADSARSIQQVAEEETVLPEGHGRADTFAACTACHSTAIIRRSHFSRAQWDGLMDWMTERHGMNPLEGERRALIVDYLAQHFAPSQAPRARNPFLD